MRTLDIPNAQPPALTFADALNSPCATCEGTPCCQNLPLQTFALSNVTDVDYAMYLLNFHNIELGVAADGTWSAYYRQACRFLDPNTLGCGLHGTPDKPHVCVQYNPFSCFYRRGFSEEGSADYLRVDRERMQTIASSLVFDADRQIIAAPTLESLAEVFGAQPILDDVVPYQESPAASSESGSSETSKRISPTRADPARRTAAPPYCFRSIHRSGSARSTICVSLSAFPGPRWW